MLKAINNDNVWMVARTSKILRGCTILLIRIICLNENVICLFPYLQDGCCTTIIGSTGTDCSIAMAAPCIIDN